MPNTKKITAITVVLLIVVAVPASLYIKKLASPPPKPIPGSVTQERVMIIAPHPDDECLSTAGVIMQALSRKDMVRLVMITCGDSSYSAAQLFVKKKKPTPGDFKKMGIARSKETLQAMSSLGLDSKNVRFLCFPDGGLIYLWRRHWDYDNPRLSSGVQVSRTPYIFAAKKNAPYSGQSVVDALAGEIGDYKPTQIYYPSTYDDHPDHWATGAFVEYVLFLKGLEDTTRYTYLVHRYMWPQPLMKSPRKPLLPPPELASLIKWTSLPLTAGQTNSKGLALRFYQTQERVSEPFLSSFVRNSELFAPGSNEIMHRVKDVSSPSPGGWGKVKEPKADTITRIVDGSADIVALQTAVEESRVRFILKTRKNVLPVINYFIDARFYYQNNQPKHLELQIKGGKAFTSMTSNHSPEGKVSALKISNNTIDITFHSNDIKGATKIMISAYSEHKKVKDRTVMKVLTID